MQKHKNSYDNMMGPKTNLEKNKLTVCMPGFIWGEWGEQAYKRQAGANWNPMLYTGEHFKVSPFLSTYNPVQEIPIARCCTVWNSDEGTEYLLVGDEMIWFGNTLADSLINPNELRAYGLLVNDNPFSAN